MCPLSQMLVVCGSVAVFPLVVGESCTAKRRFFATVQPPVFYITSPPSFAIGIETQLPGTTFFFDAEQK